MDVEIKIIDSKGEGFVGVGGGGVNAMLCKSGALFIHMVTPHPQFHDVFDPGDPSCKSRNNC